MIDPHASGTPAEAGGAPDPRPTAAPAPVVVIQRASGVGRLAAWWLLASLVLLAVCAVCLGLGLSHADISPLHVIIEGDDAGGITVQGADPATKALLAAGALAAAMFALLLVPVIVLGALSVALAASVLGVALPLVALALALVVLSSPVWLVALAAWLMARRRRALAYAASATIRA